MTTEPVHPEHSRRAGFLVRFVASWLDANIVFIPTALLLIPAAGARTVPELGASLAFVLAALLTWCIIGIFYSSATTYWWGGTPGKLLTGLRVTGEDGKPLTFKRLLFRHTIGYQLSGLLLGLGFGAVIKDVNKQGWHDKTVGSQVIVVKSLWPLALALLIFLFAFNAITTFSSVNKFMDSDLYKNEVESTFSS